MLTAITDLLVRSLEPELCAGLCGVCQPMMQQSMCRIRAANGGRSGRMRMPVQESASTQIAARILADVKSHLSAEQASKAAVRAQATSPSAASGSRAGQASLGQPSPQVI